MWYAHVLLHLLYYFNNSLHKVRGSKPLPYCGSSLEDDAAWAEGEGECVVITRSKAAEGIAKGHLVTAFFGIAVFVVVAVIDGYNGGGGDVLGYHQ